MGSIAKFISSKIDNFVIGVVEKKLGFKIESAFFSPAGDDSVPLPDDKLFTVNKDGSGVSVIIGSLMISQGAKPGEKILYSRASNGDVKSKLYLNKDGKFYFNDGTIPAARKDDPVSVTIPALSFIVSVSGGSGAPAVGVLNPTPVIVDGTITEGTEEVLLP